MVTDGGDAARQRRPRRVLHGRHDLAVLAAGQVADRIGARVEGQVDVGVDESG